MQDRAHVISRAQRIVCEVMGSLVAVLLLLAGCGGSEAAEDARCEPVTIKGVAGLDAAILLAADASGPNDVWAVGSAEYLSPSGVAIALRWDGDRWTRRTIAGVDALYDVTVIGSRDAWAIGPRGVSGDDWLGHWDGTKWAEVQPPPRWKYVTANAIDGVAPDDVWLVGTDWGSTGNDESPYISHWNGERWTLSEVTPSRGLLEDISAFSSHAAWAVGYAAFNEFGEGEGTLALRWNGKEWVEIVTPAEIDGLNNVTATNGDEAWVVPDYYTGEPSPLWRWDGTMWTKEASPIYEISVMSALDGDLWAAGSNSKVAIARLSDHEWEEASLMGVQSLDADDPFPGLAAVSGTTAWGVGRKPVASRACVGSS
jgi:hypothetical protein